MAYGKINLMISSRCEVQISAGKDEKPVKLTQIRQELKKELESEKFLGGQLVDVWINEDESEDTSESAWEKCCKRAKDCDIFIGILDGNAGWKRKEDGSGIGICHAEFEEAHSSAPKKVRLVRVASHISDGNGPNDLFKKSVEKGNLWENQYTGTAQNLKKKLKTIVRDQILQLSHEGSRELKKSGPNSGEALEWQRLSYKDRQKHMLKAANESLLAEPGSKNLTDGITIPLKDAEILFVPSAIPAAFSVSAARELVGQPFLLDHNFAKHLTDGVIGPVHLILCQKTVSESQAIQLLGFPDATIVHGSFGTYVADNVQKIQMCLIANCKDVAGTRHGIQRLFEWLRSSGEEDLLIARAKSRCVIAKAINEEME